MIGYAGFGAKSPYHYQVAFSIKPVIYGTWANRTSLGGMLVDIQSNELQS